MQFSIAVNKIKDFFTRLPGLVFKLQVYRTSTFFAGQECFSD